MKPDLETKVAKGLPLAKTLKKAQRSDKTVLADMGLAALLPDVGPEADPPRPRAGAAPRVQIAPANLIKARAAEVAAIRAAPHKRPQSHLLRLMEPGRAYVVNDLIRACLQLTQDNIKVCMRRRLIQQGFVERVAAPQGMPHRAPLYHGSRHKDPIRWLYRLTEAGVIERGRVLDGDAGER